MPSFSDWKFRITDLQLAINAVMAIYHMADHYFYSFSASDRSRVLATSSPGRFRTEMAKRDSYYAIIRDVAEAHKHIIPESGATDCHVFKSDSGGFSRICGSGLWHWTIQWCPFNCYRT